MGRLKVEFTKRGAVKAWSGNPIVVDAEVPEDGRALATLNAFKMPILAASKRIVGRAPEGVPNTDGRVRESAMGNVIADAMFEACAAAKPDFAFMNGGGVRAALPSGPITYDKLVEVQPFGNTLMVMELSGTEVRGALEYGLSGLEETKGRFLQVSKGFRYAFDPSKPVGARILSASWNGAPIEDATIYRVAFNNFTANGGDGFDVLKNAKGARLDLGLLDIDALEAYIAKHPLLPSKPEGRIDRKG